MPESDDRSPENTDRHDVFDDLLTPAATSQAAAPAEEGASFSIGFRGYDRHEVDTAIGELTARLQQVSADVAASDQRHREALDKMRADQQDEIERLVADNAETLERVRSEGQESRSRLEADLAATQAQLGDAETRVTALTAELAGTPVSDEDSASNREQFEAVLRVAEEQASLLIQNAANQAERLLESAREEASATRNEGQADAATISTKAQHDADQVRLRIDTEYTAHEARIQREAAHAAEKVAQAEREAETIRSEAEKGAATLRAMVTRETTDMRADAERAVREMNARVLEFEESLTRRQDDAQQEFLVLHNQAVAHAERITSDANAQVAASLEHAQRISNKAEDYERLMRAQAGQIEADARVRAEETLERARTKAQKIVDSVTEHSSGVLRDAEDRTRQLRWQQQQLNSFMAEVRELIRPDVRGGGTPAASGEAAEAKDALEGAIDESHAAESGDEESAEEHTEASRSDA